MSLRCLYTRYRTRLKLCDLIVDVCSIPIVYNTSTLYVCQFRCYPTKEPEQILLRWIGCQSLFYNAKVSEDRFFRSIKRRCFGCD